MTLFFKSRTLARQFTSINGKVVDHGTDAPVGRRWGFLINKVV